MRLAEPYPDKTLTLCPVTNGGVKGLKWGRLGSKHGLVQEGLMKLRQVLQMAVSSPLLVLL